MTDTALQRECKKMIERSIVQLEQLNKIGTSSLCPDIIGFKLEELLREISNIERISKEIVKIEVELLSSREFSLPHYLEDDYRLIKTYLNNKSTFEGCKVKSRKDIEDESIILYID